jgi:hypothetical protein
VLKKNVQDDDFESDGLSSEESSDEINDEGLNDLESLMNKNA